MYEIAVESRETEDTVSGRRDPRWLDFLTCDTYDMASEMLVVMKGTYRRAPGGDALGGEVRPFEIIAYPLSNVGRIEIKFSGDAGKVGRAGGCD